MAINSNFGEEKDGSRHGDKHIMRIPSGPDIGSDAKGLKPAKNCSYLWLATPRRRQDKGWRNFSPIN